MKTLWCLGSTDDSLLRTKQDLPVSSAFQPINTRQWLVRIDGSSQEAPALPQILTGDLTHWGAGVEQLVLEFEAAAGFYEFRFTFWEQRRRAIKEGPNTPWVMARTHSRSASATWPGVLDGPFMRKWLEGTEDQLEKENPESSLTFHTVDQYLNQPDEAFVRIRVDGRDQRPVVVAHPEFTREAKNVFYARTEMFRFVLTGAGAHRIALEPARLHFQGGPATVHGRASTKALLPLKYELNSIVVEDISQRGRAIRGQVYLDAWGWEAPITYQRKESAGDQEEATLEYIRRNVLDESFRWGANLMEFYTPDMSHKMASPFRWPEDDPIKGGGLCRNHPHSIWTAEDLIAVSRHAHERGMLLLWYMHCPCEGDYWDAPNWWLFNLSEVVARDFGDILKLGWKDAMDGFEQESAGSFASPDGINQILRMWKYHPGMFQGETYGVRSQRVQPVETPAMIFVPTNSHQFQIDNFRPTYYGDVGLKGKCGHQYMVHQADARGASYRIGGSVTSRPRTRPDWVLKQCNDWFRERALSDDYHASGIWWLGEAPETSPKWMRRYVYGITQDPLKTAIATKLESLGKGGEMPNSRSHKFPAYLHPRYTQEAGNSFIQQNYMRLYVHPEKDETELVIDPQGLAWYDTGSLTVTALKPCFKTVIYEGGTQLFNEFSSKITFLETAGHRAELQQECTQTYAYLGMTIQETRNIITDNDTPYLRINLKRRVHGLAKPAALPKLKSVAPKAGAFSISSAAISEKVGHTHGWQRVGTRIGCSGYDILEVDGIRNAGAASSATAPPTLVLRDSRNLLPPSFLLLHDHANMAGYDWLSGDKLVLWSPVEKPSLKLVIGVLDRGFGAEDLADLADFLAHPDRTVRLGATSTAIRPRSRLAVAEVVRVLDPAGGPYFVREEGWWLFRGAEPALENEYDYLKVYTRADDEPIIHRFSCINGVARPGWGCQYAMALRDVEGDDHGAQCVARVMTVTPLVFAPRIEFAKAIRSATVNGRPWFYFDDKVVFLPNERGEYAVEVGYGECEHPHVVASFARIMECAADQSRLTINAQHPPWVTKTYPAVKYHAAVRMSGCTIKKIENGSTLREEDTGAVITFNPGNIVIHFGTR